MASRSRPSRRSLGWPGLLGLVVTVVLLWWTLRGENPAEIARHLQNIRWVPFLAMILAATLRFPLVTVRWRYLLRLDGAALPFAPLWHATAIGFMANNLLPARGGEVARAFTASRLTSVKFTNVAATLLVERVMDGLTLVALLLVAIPFGGFTTATTIGGVSLGKILLVTAGAFSAVLVTAVATVHRPDMAMRIVTRTSAAVLPPKGSTAVVNIAKGLLEGLDVLRSWSRFAAVAAWSLAVWGMNGLSFWLCLIAFDINVPHSAALVLQSLIAFGVAAPSAPGFFGVFEAVTKATLTAYGVSGGVAVSFAVGYHITTFIPITLLGLYSLSRAHLHLADLGGSDTRDAPATAQPI